MDVETYREHCISKPGVTEGFPFGNETLAFKVMGKVFALANIDLFISANLKCDPERAVQLREQYDGGILPGYHMNKQHWNTVMMDGGVPDILLRELIDHSYDLVVSGLPKKLKEELNNL
jgi:predicted DNA-binding protein (MmcQ/YjbR family)